MEDLRNVDHVLELRSNVTFKCECGYQLSPRDFGGNVNHFLQHHGYVLLHVGSETEAVSDGEGGSRPQHITVAMLGKEV